MEKATGIEASFITSWEEWDALGAGDVLLFHNVKLKQEVFPFPIEDDVNYDFILDLQNSMIAVYVQPENDEPVFMSKFKAVLA